MNKSSQISQGLVLSYVSIFFSIITGLLYTPWMINELGKQDYGLYILATSFLAYFVFDFGLGQTIARYITKYRVEKNEHEINNILGLTTKVLLFFDLIILIVLIIVFALVENIFIKLSPTELEKFKVVFLIAGLYGILSFPFTSLNGILTAYERFKILKLFELLNKSLFVILLTIFLLLGYKLFALVMIYAVIGILIIVLKLLYISKTTPIKVNIGFSDTKLLKELFNFSLWITVIGISQRLLMNITPTILAIFSGTEEITIFSIGMIIEGYTWTIAYALNGLFLPKVTYLTKSPKEINELLIKVGRIQLIIMGLFVVCFITLGKEFISLWMGNGFKKSFYVALILISPGIVTLTQEIAHTYMYVIKEIKFRAIISIIASILSVIISIILSPKYGAIGSAVAILFTYITCHVIAMNIYYWRILKLDIPLFFKKCHLNLLMPLLLSLCVGYMLHFLKLNDIYISFIVKIILLGVFYSIIMWSIGLNLSEKQLAYSVLRRLRFSQK